MIEQMAIIVSWYSPPWNEIIKAKRIEKSGGRKNRIFSCRKNVLVFLLKSITRLMIAKEITTETAGTCFSIFTMVLVMSYMDRPSASEREKFEGAKIQKHAPIPNAITK